MNRNCTKQLNIQIEIDNSTTNIYNNTYKKVDNTFNNCPLWHRSRHRSEMTIRNEQHEHEEAETLIKTIKIPIDTQQQKQQGKQNNKNKNELDTIIQFCFTLSFIFR
jgi:hypothetical protein